MNITYNTVFKPKNYLFLHSTYLYYIFQIVKEHLLLQNASLHIIFLDFDFFLDNTSLCNSHDCLEIHSVVQTGLEQIPF